MKPPYHATCERCGAMLCGEAVWLELNTVTGRYSKGPVPEDESQGCFPFGRDCANRVLKNGGRCNGVQRRTRR